MKGPPGYPGRVSARVRAAEPVDAGAIARVHAESWRLTYAGLVSSRYLAGLDEDVLGRHWAERLRGEDRDELVLVGEDGGEVVGFCVARPSSDEPDLAGFAGEIQMLYVRPPAQRRGLGAAMFEAARAALADSRLYWLVVWVVEANHAARAFYRRVGLRPDGARRDQRLAGEPVTVVRYAGPLNPVIDFAALRTRR
jgi:ribosomal protein S18 acetylase RimI-like enzyme